MNGGLELLTVVLVSGMFVGLIVLGQQLKEASRELSFLDARVRELGLTVGDLVTQPPPIPKPIPLGLVLEPKEPPSPAKVHTAVSELRQISEDLG